MGSGVRFRYREEGNPPIARPTVDVRLQHGETGDWTVRALIDSGAPISLFDRGVADALGIRIGQAGARTGTTRLLGGSWSIQFEHVDLCLPAHPEIEWSAEVAFVKSPELQMPFQGLLGSDGFLTQFAVTFNQYYGYFLIDRPDDCDDRLSS